MSDKQTLKSQITQLKGLLDSPKTQGSTRKIFESSLKKAEDKLAELEKAEKLESSKKELTPKQEAKVEETKKEAKSLSKALKDKVAKAKEKLAKIKPTKTTKKGGARSVTKAKEIAKEMRSKQKKQSLADKDIESDANRYAINKTKRRSNGGRANQYGTKAENKGGIYYESRENRYDRQNKRYAKLEDGGETYADGGYEDFGYHNINREVTLKNGKKVYITKGRYYWQNELVDNLPSGVYYLTNDGNYISADEIKFPLMADGGRLSVAKKYDSVSEYMKHAKKGDLVLIGKDEDVLKYASDSYLDRFVEIKDGEAIFKPFGRKGLVSPPNHYSVIVVNRKYADGGAITDIGGTKFSTTDLSGMFAHGGATNHGTRFMSHSGMKYENGGQLSMLEGRVVKYNAMGGVSGTFVIDKATVTPDFYRKRDVHLFTKSGSRDSFPLEKLDDFLSGEEVEVRDSKGEAYTLELVGAMKKEFAKGGINKGGAWTRDHYQYNKSESYEVPTKDRVYEKGGYPISDEKKPIIKKGYILVVKDTEEEAKEYVSKYPDLYYEKFEDRWAVKKSFADGGAITDIGGTKFSTTDLSGMFAKGGMTEHGLKNGDKIISAKLIGTTIRVRNEALDEDARVDLNTGKRTILTYNAKTKKWDEKMERGGDIEVKEGDIIKSKTIKGKVYQSMGTMFKIEDEYGNKNPKFYSTRDFKKSEIIKMEKGGQTSKSKYKVGDMVYTYQNPDEKRNITYLRETELGTKYKISLKDKDGYSYSGNFIDEKSISKTSRKSDALKVKNGKMSVKDFSEKWGNEMYLKNYGMGGKTTYEDKVTAISKSLLKRKKVSPSVQKDYGKTYSKSEALDSAKRIAGAMRAKEMSKKKS